MAHLDPRPRVLLACNPQVRRDYITAAALERLGRGAAFSWAEFNESSGWDAPPAASAAALVEFSRLCRSADALVVCHGSPRVSAEVLDAAPGLRFVGELEGDRFAQRIDVEAASARGVRAVDTTHGSSYPVSEWALALMMVGLRNAGSHFRRLIAGGGWMNMEQRLADPGYQQGELTGRTVGLIGCGHIGRRLLQLLAPFECRVFVHDPYIPREMADAVNFTLTSLDHVLSSTDVVVCLAPLTPGTRGMLGEREFGLLRSGTVFVNVSRGPIMQTGPLITRLQRRDIIACLDVFDPEPIPPDSPVRQMENVFLSPHIAGVTARSRTRFFDLMVDELERFFAGHETRHDLLPRTLANRRGQPPPPR
jgi:phosphoglycerate dehydrogenase-like enzyme